MKYCFEPFEPRILLSAIVWDNRGSDNFQIYGSSANAARAIVDQAIQYWSNIITSFNYQAAAGQSTPADVFSVTIRGANINNLAGFAGANGKTGHFNSDYDAQGKPHHATITLDDNGGDNGHGWNFDPGDDTSEYTQTVSPYAAIGQTTGVDFYTTALHELGHALGLDAGWPSQLSNLMNDTGISNPDDGGQTDLFNIAGFGTQFTLTSNGHTYGGPPAGGLTVHTDDLMNVSNPVNERRVVSDVDAAILQDVYGYSISSPPAIDAPPVVITPPTVASVALVSGVLTLEGTDGNDSFTVTNDQNGHYVVAGNGVTTQAFAIGSVQQIVAHVYGGDDSVVIANTVSVNASIFGGAGNDTLVGGFGSDYIQDPSGTNLIMGGPGNDTLIGGTGDDYIIGGAGNDSLSGQSLATGAGGNDTLWGGWHSDTLVAGNGNDLLEGRGGDDLIYANNGLADTIFGGVGNDTVHVDPGNIDLTPNPDVESVLIGA